MNERGQVKDLSRRDADASRIPPDPLNRYVAIKDTRLKVLPRGTVMFVVRGMILAHTFPVALADTE
ncbi:MAG: hypothetical protein P8Y25_09050, partial [Chromatiaceae bacterium]